MERPYKEGPETLREGMSQLSVSIESLHSLSTALVTPAGPAGEPLKGAQSTHRAV